MLLITLAVCSMSAFANLDLTDPSKRGGQRSDQLSGWSIEWIREKIPADLTDISVLQKVNMQKYSFLLNWMTRNMQKCGHCAAPCALYSTDVKSLQSALCASASV